MLGLTLRQEFQGRRLKGTAIELSNDAQTGATQRAISISSAATFPFTSLRFVASGSSLK
jgi:hypothetical protein